MLKFLISLFRYKDWKESTSNFVEEEPIEKRKCKGCLRKYDIDKPRCPYCGCYDFYNC